MHSMIVFTMLVAYVASEVPSNTYLPPPSRGYPQGGPEVIAARSLDRQGNDGNGNTQGHGQEHGVTVGANGFARSGNQNPSNRSQGSQARSNHEEHGSGYDQKASAFAKNTVDGSTETANYNYGYKVDEHGADFGHQESRRDEEARGEYHVVLPDGRKQTVSYEADQRGFKPQISYEDSDIARSGYDSNAKNYGNTGYRGNEQNGARSNFNSRNGGYNN